MGGTSYDVCLIRDGRPELRSDWNWRHRYCIALPMVDIHAIGAGGGSVVQPDGTALRVGPESAGSQPGPVCYGRGGTRRDGHRRGPRARAVSTPKPSGAAVRGSTRRRPAPRSEAVGRELGLGAEETAIAAVRVVDAHMTDAVRRVLSSAGVDPRQVDLFAFGGMGPLHATAQAAALGVRRVLIPRGPRLLRTGPRRRGPRRRRLPGPHRRLAGRRRRPPAGHRRRARGECARAARSGRRPPRSTGPRLRPQPRLPRSDVRPRDPDCLLGERAPHPGGHRGFRRAVPPGERGRSTDRGARPGTDGARHPAHRDGSGRPPDAGVLRSDRRASTREGAPAGPHRRRVARRRRRL